MPDPNSYKKWPIWAKMLEASSDRNRPPQADVGVQFVHDRLVGRQKMGWKRTGKSFTCTVLTTQSVYTSMKMHLEQSLSARESVRDFYSPEPEFGQIWAV